MIIGSGKDGLPIILGNVDGPVPAPGLGPVPGAVPTAPGDKTSSAVPPAAGPPVETSPPATDQKVEAGAVQQPPEAKPAATELSPIDLSRLKALLPWLGKELSASKPAASTGAGTPKQQ